MSAAASLRLEALGTLVLRGPAAAISSADQRQQRRRLALLAVLACEGERGVSRDQLMLLFWPDSTQKRARHSLDQLLYAIRTSVNESIFAGTNPVRLDQCVIASDVQEFERALDAGRLEDAVNIYRGPFLDGFYLSDTREFEEWIDRKRNSLAHKFEDALESLARSAATQGDFEAAQRWRRKLTQEDPLSSRHTIALMRTLAASGEVGGAIACGERFVRVAEKELGASAVSSVNQLLEELRECRPTLRGEQGSVTGDVNFKLANYRVTRRWNQPALGGLAIVAALLGTLAVFAGRNKPSAAPQGEQKGTGNLAAYEYYQRGMDPVLLRNDSLSTVALGYLTKAIELDPAFAAAYAGLSELKTRVAMSANPPLPRGTLRKDAEMLARKAIALDSSLAAGHIALGLANSHFAEDLQLAEREFERALSLDPKAKNARDYLATARVVAGRPEEALRTARESVAENPLSPVARATLAIALYANGECRDALPILDSLAQLKPPLLRAESARILCLAVEGRWNEAAALVDSDGATVPPGIAGFVMARTGERGHALAIQRRLTENAASNPAAEFEMALVSFGLGEMEVASAALSKAANNGVIPWQLMGPIFEELRQTTGFRDAAARRRINLASFKAN